jgi:hypothetical protein
MQDDEPSDGDERDATPGRARVAQAMSEVVRQAQRALAPGGASEEQLRSAVARAAEAATACGLGPRALVEALDAALDDVRTAAPGAVPGHEELRATAAALLLRAHLGRATDHPA